MFESLNMTIYRSKELIVSLCSQLHAWKCSAYTWKYRQPIRLQPPNFLSLCPKISADHWLHSCEFHYFVVKKKKVLHISSVIKLSDLDSNKMITGGTSLQHVVFSTNLEVCVTWSYDHASFTIWCPSCQRGTGVEKRCWLLFQFGANQSSSNSLKTIITTYARSIRFLFCNSGSV